MIAKDQTDSSYIEQATSCSGPWFLFAGVAATIVLGITFVFLSVLFPELSSVGYHVYYALFIIPILLTFPISIVIFPWIYATRWHVSDDEIICFVPAPRGASKIWKIKNGGFKVLNEGLLFSVVICHDLRKIRVPRFLRITKSNFTCKIKFSLRGDKLVLTKPE